MASGRIPREFIDDLLLRADIVDVINARVPLKKKGREYTACCPFHNEKTPSFTVSPSKQFYHCFGCGAHGTALSFLMDYEHLDFVEAVESLADGMGLTIPREQGGRVPDAARRKRSRDLFELMEDANRFFQSALRGADQAIKYLKDRGLSGDICQRFNLGYAPAGWDTLSRQFGERYTTQQWLDSGLMIRNDNGKVYDRYRDRIQFPIRNRKGQVIGFGGRVLGDEKPKYINSPETTLFHKGSELYGLYEARKFTQKLERIIVVEGYMDVIALAQFGFSNAVATLGTATTQDHIKLLFRTVPEIIFCFDGDRAGREAAWRAVENALPVMQDGKEIRFLFLPEGEDPDTQVRKSGKEAFEASLQSARSLSRFFLDSLHERFNISTGEGKARFIEAAAKHLKQMPESLIKDQLLQKISTLTNVGIDAIQKHQQVSKANLEPEKRISRLNEREVRKTPVRYAISLLLNQPELVQFVDNIEQIVLSELPGADLLSTLVETLQENPQTNAAVLLEKWRDTELEPVIAKLMQWQPVCEDSDVLARELNDCLRQIRKQARQKAIEQLIHKDRTDGLSEQEKQDLRALYNDND